MADPISEEVIIQALFFLGDASDPTRPPAWQVTSERVVTVDGTVFKDPNSIRTLNMSQAIAAGLTLPTIANQFNMTAQALAEAAAERVTELETQVADLQSQITSLTPSSDVTE